MTNNKEKTEYKSQNTHINTIQMKENKQLNIQQKQNYPDSVAFYNTQPGNEVGLFYNGPEHHMGHLVRKGPTKSNSHYFFEVICVSDLCTQNTYMYIELCLHF